MVWSCALTPAARRHGHDVTVGPPAGLGTVAAALAAPAVAALTLTLALLTLALCALLALALLRQERAELGSERVEHVLQVGGGRRPGRRR